MLLLGMNALWLPDHALAASYTWDGGGADNNWSTCANWSTDVCPVAGDTVTFNATSTKNSTVDASWGGTLASLNIAAGYTGTINLARSIAMTTQYTQHTSTSTFTAGSHSFTTAIFTISAGTFTASSGTTTATSTITISGTPTFNANGGTFAISGSSTTPVACANVTFNLVTFTNTNTKTIGSDCSLPLGNNPSIGSSVTLNGTLSGTGTMTTAAGTLIQNSGSSITGFSGVVANGAYTVAGATVNLGSYTTVDFNAAFNLSSGTFTAPSGTATFASTFNITGGTFNANGGTVTFDSSSIATLTCNAASFNLVTFNAGTASKTVTSGCNFPLGANPTILARVTLDGTLSGTGTITFGSGSNEVVTTNITANGVLSGFTGLATNNGAGTFTLTGATFNASAYTTFDMKYNFVHSTSGTFTAPSGNAYFGRSFTLNPGTTFNANGGTITFNNTSATLACNNTSFSKVVIDKPAAGLTVVVGSDCSLPLGSNPTVSLGGGSLTINGALSGTGTLTRTGGGTFQINSTGGLSGFSDIVAASTFVVDAATLNLSSYTTADFNGHFTLQNGGTLTAPSGTASFAGNFTLNSGTTFNASGGTIEFDGTSSVALSCNNATFNLVNFRHSAGTKTVNSTCALPLGNNPTIGVDGTARLTLNGTLSGSGLLTMGTPVIQVSTLTLNNGSVLSGFNGLRVNGGLTVNGTFNFGAFTTFDVDGTLTINATGNLTGPAAGGDLFGFSNADGIFNANGGTINIDWISSNIQCTGSHTTNFTKVNLVGTGTVSLYGCDIPLGNNPTTSAGINNSGTVSGSGKITINGDVTHQMNGSLSGFSGLVVNGNFQSYAGNLNLGSYTTADFNGYFWLVGGTFIAPVDAPLYVAGSFSNSNITDFNPNGGTVILDGGNQNIYSDATFYNLTKEVTTTSTLYLYESTTQTILNKLVLKGTPLQLLSIESDVPNVPWQINLGGTADVCSVEITDSISTGNTITAYSSFSNSANPGWVFNDASCPSSGGGGGSGGVIEPTTAVTNFQFAQAAVAAATSSEKQIGLVLGATNQRLPSPISSIFGRFPKGPAVIHSILGFFAVCLLIVVAASIGLWRVFVWKNRHNKENWQVQTRAGQDTW